MVEKEKVKFRHHFKPHWRPKTCFLRTTKYLQSYYCFAAIIQTSTSSLRHEYHPVCMILPLRYTGHPSRGADPTIVATCKPAHLSLNRAYIWELVRSSEDHARHKLDSELTNLLVAKTYFGIFTHLGEPSSNIQPGDLRLGCLGSQSGALHRMSCASYYVRIGLAARGFGAGPVVHSAPQRRKWRLWKLLIGEELVGSGHWDKTWDIVREVALGIYKGVGEEVTTSSGHSRMLIGHPVPRGGSRLALWRSASRVALQ
ncbi:hypothetical protein BDY19DRAFT_902922 [Irpex rosettiformis]|uniref:Uncharacterized protein n=1 Tax=Irpex rosettiformis TaxID=378272 RepID=A0ACB8UFI5_9APHY|nr:hypothetical protein BDY19DRAFT_902922 [Irpex rosettiformis]